MVSIIIMNLLVGLAISNITGQLQSAGVYRLKVPTHHNKFFFLLQFTRSTSASPGKLPLTLTTVGPFLKNK